MVFAGTSLGLMKPVSKSWLQSSVGIVHVSSGGETPSWLYRARESGMLISEVYLRSDKGKRRSESTCDSATACNSSPNLTYFHCPLMFLMKQLGTPYQVRVLLVGSPKTEW